MIIFKQLIRKNWLTSFISSVIVLFLLIAVAKLVSGLLRSSVTPQEVVINFLLEIPLWISKILPISCLVGTLFCINKLKSKNELIAIFSSGFSHKEFILTIVQISLWVGLFQFINASVLDPYAKKLRYEVLPSSLQKFRHNKNMGLKMSSLESGKIWYKSENYFFSYGAYDKHKKSLKNVNIYFLGNNNQIRTITKAKSANYLQDEQWLLLEGERLLSLSGTGFPQKITFKEHEVKINLNDSDLNKIDSDISTLGPLGLLNFIRKLKDSGVSSHEYEMMLFDKFSTSALCVIFALLTIFPIYNPGKRHSSQGKTLLFTFVFTILYWFAQSSTLALGTTGKIPATAASFALPVLFLAFILQKIKKNSKLST